MSIDNTPIDLVALKIAAKKEKDCPSKSTI
jgi:hypothetical protein